MHFMERQARMLAEEGNDISASVMHQAQAMLALEHARAEEADRKYRVSGSTESKAAAWDKVCEAITKRLGGSHWLESGTKNGAQCAVHVIETLGLSVYSESTRRDPRSLNDEQFREAGFSLAWLEGAAGSCPSMPPESTARHLKVLRDFFNKEDGK